VPELDATVNFSQEAGRRHKDVWEHTKQVVMQSPAQPIVRWAALLHDIGKVGTRVMLSEGKVTFHRHADVGARLFETLARRLVFLAPSASASAFSSSTTCAPTPTSRNGPTQPCVASITKWAMRCPSLSSCHEPTSLGTARPTSGGGPQHRGVVAENSGRARARRPCATSATGVGNAIMEAFAIPPSRGG